MAGLKTYQAKRKFGVTAEPKGKIARRQGHAFVIQKHAARRLHYDLRLELDGVMKSWAVTRGPSLVSGEKRLAVQVEDHPIDYNKFEGTIPKGEYGGGTVMIWDRGSWQPQEDPHQGLRKGHLSFTLDGEKLHGLWHLVRMHRRRGEKRDNWLLIKAHDAAAREAGAKDILEQKSRSVVSGRSRWTRSPKARLKKTTKLKTPNKKKSPSAKTSGKRARAAAAAILRRTKKFMRTQDKAASRRAALPAFVAPCLATLADKAPQSDNWIHEIKFDGYRLQARLDNGKVKLLTRRGLDWTKKFPAIAEAIATLPATSRADRRRTGGGRRRRRLELFPVAAGSQGRPPRPHGALRLRPAASRRQRSKAAAVARAQASAGAAVGEGAQRLPAALERVADRAGPDAAQARLPDGAGRHRLQARRRRLSFRPRPRLDQDQMLRPAGTGGRGLCAVERRRACGRRAGARLLRKRQIALRRTHRHRLQPCRRARTLSQAQSPQARHAGAATGAEGRTRRARADLGFARAGGRGRFPRLDPWRPGAAGLVPGAARGQAGQAGRARSQSHGGESESRGQAQRAGAKRQGHRRRRDFVASRPRLLARRRRQQARSRRILHADLAMDATACRRPPDRAVALSGGRGRAMLFPETCRGRHRHRAPASDPRERATRSSRSTISPG